MLTYKIKQMLASSFLLHGLSSVSFYEIAIFDIVIDQVGFLCRRLSSYHLTLAGCDVLVALWTVPLCALPTPPCNLHPQFQLTIRLHDQNCATTAYWIQHSYLYISNSSQLQVWSKVTVYLIGYQRLDDGCCLLEAQYGFPAMQTAFIVNLPWVIGVMAVHFQLT